MTARGAAPDVAIIGGGIVGAATAAFLADAGMRVTLFERATIAAAASGRNSGVIQHPFDPVLVALYRESLAAYRALESSSEMFRIPAEPAGLLAVGWDDDLAAGLAAEWAAAYPDTRPDLVAGSALRELEPALAPDVIACRIAIGYPVVPAAATTAFAALAEARGATIRTDSDVGLAVTAGAVDGVAINGRIEPAGAVVVAAGPWSPAIVDPSGSWRPIRGIWGVVADVHLANPPRHVLEEIAIDIEPVDGASPAAGTGVDFSLVTANGASSLGSTFMLTQPDPDQFAAPLLERGARFVPEIGMLPIRGLRACARPLALDGRPLIGPVPGLARAFIAAGNGPWGISTGPATARLVADQVLGGGSELPASLDAARFGPIRAG